jgi:hypothetical protein
LHNCFVSKEIGSLSVQWVNLTTNVNQQSGNLFPNRRVLSMQSAGEDSKHIMLNMTLIEITSYIAAEPFSSSESVNQIFSLLHLLQLLCAMASMNVGGYCTK